MQRTEPVAMGIFGRLSRRTSSGRYIPEVDGLRFISIALVVAFHLSVVTGLAAEPDVLHGPFGVADLSRARAGLLDRVLGQASIGVEVFFMISGFILALPFLSSRAGDGPPVDLRRYFLRRLSRIEPPLVVVLLALFAMTTAAGAGVRPSNLVAGLAYLHGPVYGEPNRLDGVAWSLEVEVQFYAVLPLLAILLCHRQPRVRRLSVLVAAAAATAIGPHTLYGEPRIRTFLVNYLAYFLAGWLLADLYLFEWRSAPAPDRRWDLVSLAVWPTLFASLLMGPMARVVIGPVLVFLIGAAAFRGVTTRRILRDRRITTIGGMAYSIYLVHWPVLVLVERQTRSLHDPAGLGDLAWAASVAIPAVLLVALLLFVLIERPCMDPAWPTRAWVACRRVARSATTERADEVPVRLPEPVVVTEEAQPVWKPRTLPTLVLPGSDRHTTV